MLERGAEKSETETSKIGIKFTHGLEFKKLQI